MRNSGFSNAGGAKKWFSNVKESTKAIVSKVKDKPVQVLNPLLIPANTGWGTFSNKTNTNVSPNPNSAVAAEVKRLEELAKQAAGANQNITLSETNQAATQQQTSGNNPGTSTNTGMPVWGIALIVVGGLAVVGGGLYFALKN